MTLTVRPVPTEGPDFDRYIAICANAYPNPGFTTPDAIQSLAESVRESTHEPAITLWGAYRDGQVVGTMRYFDFAMRIRSVEGFVGGVGMVATDLAHKKTGVAAAMIRDFLAHYRDRGATMAILHPFRHDFYRRMGWGYGTPLSQYRLRPADLPARPAPGRARPLGPADLDAFLACHDRLCARTNGLIRAYRSTAERQLSNVALRVVGYEEEGTLRGYLNARFVPRERGIQADLVVDHCLAETRAAFDGLLAFLRAQADQCPLVIFNTQEEGFYLLPTDPRDGSETILQMPAYHQTHAQGLGMMYRVLDTPGVFTLLRDHDFGGQSLTLRLTVRDSFFPPNDGTTTIRFANGRPTLAPGEEPDITLALDVADFSSLLIGSIRFRTLHRLGLAEIGDPGHVSYLDRLFAADQPPVCTTRF
jgi:predicted N-acetyltransferase YhbS